jgi:hypothetical protein
VTTSDTPYEPGLVTEPDVDDDWDDAPITPRARAPRATKLLVVAAVTAAAFAGGVFAQRSWGAGSGGSDTGTARGAGPAQLAGSGGNATRRFGNGAGGQATIGQVSYVKGSTLYVTSAGGGTVKVSVPKGTPVTTSVTSDIGAVHPGDTVVVRGTAGKNGTVRAQSVSVGGAGGGLFAGGQGAPTGFGNPGGARGFGGGATGSGGGNGAGPDGGGATGFGK